MLSCCQIEMDGIMAYTEISSSNAHLPEYSEEDDYITSPESFSAENNSNENDRNNEESPDDEISYKGNKNVLKGMEKRFIR